MTVGEAYERDDGLWVLPLADAEIHRVGRDAHHGIVLSLLWPDRGEACEIHLQECTVITARGERHELNCDEPRDYAPALALAGAIVSDATVTQAAGLTILLRDGGRIEARGHPRYESWELRGPGQLLVVAMPGDQVAVWT